MSKKIYQKKSSEPDSAYQLIDTISEEITSDITNNLEPGTEYTFKVVRSLPGYRDSAPRFVTFTTQGAPGEEDPNIFPLVSLVIDDNSITTAENALLTATPTDSDGTISKVEFYMGATLLGAVTSAPYIWVVGGSAGSYTFTAKAFDNDNASTVSNSVGLTVTAVPVAPSFVTPTTSDFSYTVYDKDATTYRKRSAFATIQVSTDAPQLIVDLYSTMAGAGYAGADSYVSIYDASKQFVGILSPAVTNSKQTLTSATLPGTGLRNFYLVESGSTQNGPTDFVGTFITKIQASTGGISIVSQSTKPNRVIALGDSISIGDGSTNNSRYGWPILLRGLLGDTWGVTTDAWGARYTTGSLGTTQLQQEQSDRIVNHMAGASGRKVVLWNLGTNDFGYVVGNPATVAANAAAVWDLVHAADTAIEFIVVTPLWRSNKDSANSGGWVLADYATALINAASTRASFVQSHNGVAILGTGNFDTDNLHPNDSGHQILASKMNEYIFAVAVPQPVAPTWVQQNDGTNIIEIGLVAGFTLSQHEVDLNTGTWVTMSANPLFISDIPAPIGSIKVRVKAEGDRPAGQILTNTIAFTSLSQDTATYQIVDERNKYLTFTGTWAANTLASTDGGIYQQSTTAGASYKVKVHANRIKIKAIRTSVGSNFSVTLNGVAYQNGTCKAVGSDEGGGIVWDSGNLPEGDYEMIVTATTGAGVYLYFDSVYFSNPSAPTTLDQDITGYTVVDNGNAGLVKVGTWSTFSSTTLSLVNNDHAYSATNNCSISYTATCSRVKFKTFKDPALRPFGVMVDGVLYSNGTEVGTSAPSSVLWDSGPLTPGPHTIEIVSTGNPNSGGLSFDALYYLPA